MKRCIWTFIVGVTVLDVSFTWECRGSALEWESNPVVAQVMQLGGVVAAILYRVFWLTFAAMMSRTRTSLSGLITPVWGLGHLYLLLVLLQTVPWSLTLAR